MKKKLRKIVVNNLEFLYALGNRYNKENATNILTVKVYLSGQKHTPLIIKFLTIDDYYIGQPLNSGIELENRNINKPENVNLNQPFYIGQLILLGINKGWTGKNSIGIQNGLAYLEELGYNTRILKPVK